MTKRRSITTAMRLRIWAAHSGVCHLCKLPIHAERGELWDVEHIKPLWNDGADTEENMAPAHKDCHAPKTRREAKDRAKTNRQRAKYIRAEKETKRPIQSRGFTRKQRPEKIGLPPRRPMFEDMT